MLKIKTRQKYLKALGFYSGPITGKEDKLTKAAYKKLQNKYFTRAKDKDGIYGPDTDKLLRSAYNCRGLKYFKLEEFKCKCGGKYCTGYPAVVSRSLVLKMEQKVRPKYGAISIISGLRCKTWNRLQGGVSNSRHTTGKALDFQCAESRKGVTARKRIIAYCKKIFRYCYGNTSGMGASIHVDV